MIKDSGYIILEGNIGVGKSTFSEILAKSFVAEGCAAQFLPEPDDKTNPFLADYYADPKQNAYRMQMHLLHQRFKATQYAQDCALCGRGWYILDRSYFGDICFARIQVHDGYFSDAELASYLDAHRNLRRYIEPPTAAIFLKARPETCAARIRRRARNCELAIDIGYLERLDSEIEKLEHTLASRCPTIVLPWDEERSTADLFAEAGILARRLINGKRDDWDF